MAVTLGELAAALGGDLLGPADLPIERPGAFDDARPGEIVAAFTPEAVAVAEAGDAAAVIVPRDTPCAKPAIAVDDPRLALVGLLIRFDPPPTPAAGVHPTAVIGDGVELPDDVTVGPYAVLGDRVVVGAGSRIGAHCVLGDDVVLGEAVILFPQVTLYARTEVGARTRIHSGAVLGADGFGYVQQDGVHHKIPHLGQVVIGEDVEIGANTCIDRGAVGATRIGSGTKIDDHVMVGHNCRIGERVILVAQVGIGGSTTIGDEAMLGGQVGLADHLKIAPKVRLAAKSGVMKDIPEPGAYAGAPAVSEGEWFRQYAALKRFPEMRKKVLALEQRLGREDSADA